MAWDGVQNGISLPGLISGDIALSDSQFRFVQMGTATDGAVVRAATAGQQGIIGVLQEDAAAVGDPVHVCGGGVTKMLAGVAITKGARLMCDANGKAITAAVTSSNHVYGYALEAAGADGVVFTGVFGYHGYTQNNL